MQVDTQDLLKKVVRGHLGACEMRFYDDSVTVTLVSKFGDFDGDGEDNLYNEVFRLLTENNLESDFRIEVVTPNRFKLHFIPMDEQSDEQLLGLSNEDVAPIAEAIEEAFDKGSLNDQLVVDLKREIEDYLMTNLDAALVILEKSKHTITLDEVKELMRFAFMGGLWYNARERDLEVLSRAFNEAFQKYSDKWTILSNEGGRG